MQIALAACSSTSSIVTVYDGTLTHRGSCGADADLLEPTGFLSILKAAKQSFLEETAMHKDAKHS